MQETIKSYDIACFIQDDGVNSIFASALAKLETHQHKIFKGGLEEAIEYVKLAKNLKVLFIDCTAHEFVVSSAERLMEFCPPETRVIILGGRHDIGIFRDLLKIGVYDYIATPINTDLFLRSLTHALSADVVDNTTAKKTGKVVAFLGSVGGVGTTMLSVNCAYALANELGKRVVLVDTDMYYGAIQTTLDLKASHALSDAIKQPERLDDLFLERSMVSYGERLHILGGDIPLHESLAMDSASALKNLDSLLETLANKYHYIIVDLSRHHPALWQSISHKADKVFLVGDLTVTSLRNTLKIYNTLSKAKKHSAPSLVVNRVRREESTSIKQFTKLLGYPIEVMIPFSSKAVEAADLGVPLLQHSPHFFKGINLLVAAIAGKGPNLPEATKSTFFFEMLANNKLVQKLQRFLKGSSLQKREALKERS